MKQIKRLYHFLGGIYFAIFLISVAAILVTLGTFVESYTGSHLYAASWTYHNPFFTFLLSLFFINILFSALRRWPFKSRHVPFLITHLGLLMIISGTMIKNQKGLQGNLSLWEGSAGQEVLLPNSYSLHVENQAGTQSHYDLATLEPRQTLQKSFLPELKLKVLNSFPHVRDKWETWIKGEQAIISGLPPLPVNDWLQAEPLPKAILLPLSQENNWTILAVKTDHIDELIKAAYLSDLEIALVLPGESANDLHKDLLETSRLQKTLDLSYSDGFQNPYLEIQHEDEVLKIALDGDQALQTKRSNPSLISGTRYHIDLARPYPLLLLAENKAGDAFIFLFDQYGRVHGETYTQDRVKNLISYEQGFGGYAVQSGLPNPALALNRIQKEEAARQHLCEQLKEAMAKSPPLAPPLAVFKEACAKAQLDFITHFVDYLILWEQSDSILFDASRLNESLTKIFQVLDWKGISFHDRKAIQWTTLLFERIGAVRSNGELLNLLVRNRWPFVDDLKATVSDENLLTQLAQQIFTLVDDLPPLDLPQEESPADKAKYFSSYLKAFGIEYSSIQTPLEEKTELVYLETPLTLRHHKETPLTKCEDNHPCVLIEAQADGVKEIFPLAYDSSGFGFRWPILKGRYLIRFQPSSVEIPYRTRLRQARQINYPQTQQAYSYEADIWIQEGGRDPIEKTLSMNQVHETWDGYRFYLAGMSPASDQHVRRAQIIVNHDPVKYFLTYPGALLVALGILLLFWIQPYKKK
jgi:hypothetical protein